MSRPDPSAMAARGVPDWQGAVRTAAADLLAAHDDPGVRFVLPKAARLALRPDGAPELFLEFFSDRNDPDVDNSLYAMLHLGLRPDADLAALRGAAGRAADGAALLPMPFGGGNRFHLECGDTHTSVPFAWDSASLATLDARLTPLAARLLYGALAVGGATVLRSALEVEAAAVLPRLAASVRFDPRRLVPLLQDQLNPGAAGLPFEALVRLLDAEAGRLFPLDGDAAPGIGLALAGRLRQAFGRAAPCERVADGPFIGLDGTAAAAEVRWDLRTPCLAGVPVFLRCDPFTALAGHTPREQLTAFTPVKPLPDAWRTRRLTVASALPARFANCSQIALRVRVDKAVSASGATDSRSVVLHPAAPRSTEVDLVYARAGAVHPFSTSVKVVGDRAIFEEPWREGEDGSDYLLVDASRMPVPHLTLRATPALLQRAVIAFSLAGCTAGRLSLDEPATSVLLDGVDPAARLALRACDLADPARVIELDLPCRSVELDLDAFPGLGRTPTLEESPHG